MGGKLLEIPDDVCQNTLESKLVLSTDTALHIEKIGTGGDFIIGMTSSDADALFKVFSTDGQYVSSFGKIGNGADEFTQGVVLNHQHNDDCIYLHDVNSCRLYAVDLSESIQKNRTVCKNKFKTEPMTFNIYNVGDSMIIYEHTSAHEYELKQQLLNGTEIAEPIPLNEPVENLFPTCYGKMVFNSQNKSVVKASIYEDKLLFLNYGNLTRKTFVHNSDNNETDWIYYGAITSNDKSIYTLYLNQSVEDSFNVEKYTVIYVFDWQGNYKNTLNANEYLIDIAAGKNDECIYGLDMDGNIYEYRLNK